MGDSMNLRITFAAILLVATAAGLRAADLRTEAPSPTREQIKTAFLAANAAQPQPTTERIKTAFLAAAAINERGGPECRTADARDFPSANKKQKARARSRHRRR